MQFKSLNGMYSETEIIFIFIFYLMNMNTIINIKQLSKFKNKFTLNEYGYKMNIQHI
jgi:hypothetical protein